METVEWLHHSTIKTSDLITATDVFLQDGRCAEVYLTWHNKWAPLCEDDPIGMKYLMALQTISCINKSLLAITIINVIIYIHL